jgi:transposase
MCHVPAALTRQALLARGSWRCVRCGQHWDADRLAAVAAYETWVLERGVTAGPGGRRAAPSYLSSAIGSDGGTV